MDGIDRITARIRGDAESEAAAAVAAARREAEETRRRLDEEAVKQTAEMAIHGTVAAKERMQRLVGVAELEAGKSLLAAKQEMIDEAFLRAAESVAAFSREECTGFLSGLALRHLRTGEEQLILSEADMNDCGSDVLAAANEALASEGRTAALTLGEGSSKIGTGLILKDGDVEVNCTTETMLLFLRDKISGEVAEILFG